MTNPYFSPQRGLLRSQYISKDSILCCVCMRQDSKKLEKLDKWNGEQRQIAEQTGQAKYSQIISHKVLSSLTKDT